MESNQLFGQLEKILFPNLLHKKAAHRVGTRQTAGWGIHPKKEYYHDKIIILHFGWAGNRILKKGVFL